MNAVTQTLAADRLGQATDHFSGDIGNRWNRFRFNTGLDRPTFGKVKSDLVFAPGKSEFSGIQAPPHQDVMIIDRIRTEYTANRELPGKSLEKYVTM